MNIKNLIKNIGIVLVLLLIVILTQKLNNICLEQVSISMSMKYNYLALLVNLIGYTIIGFILGIDNYYL